MRILSPAIAAAGHNSRKKQDDDASDLIVSVVQPALRSAKQAPLEATQHVIDMMAKEQQHVRNMPCQTHDEQHNGQIPTASSIDLFVLPELCPVGYSEDTFANYLPTTQKLKQMFCEIDSCFAQAAQAMQAHICYGTIGWKESTDSNKKEEYFIRQVVVDPQGRCVCHYDKIHLCNYGACAETRFFTPGHTPTSFTIAKRSSTLSSSSVSSWTLGIVVCADMRYGRFAHRLAQGHGADIILQPACFERDCSFRTWQPFRETRAVENGVYWLAGNYAGNDYGEASCSPPWIDDDHEPAVLGRDETQLVVRLQKRELYEARTDLPFHQHLQQGACGCCYCGTNDDKKT